MTITTTDRPLWRPVIYEGAYDRDFWHQVVMFDGLYLPRHLLRCAALAFNNEVALNAAWDLPGADKTEDVESTLGEMIPPPIDDETFLEVLSRGEWGEINPEVFDRFYNAWSQGLTHPPP